jgi:hypothetical protein
LRWLYSRPSPEATQLAASLSYVAGDLPLEPGSGIVSVGNFYFPNGYPRLVHLAPGKREIGFYCAGQIYVDGPATSRTTSLMVKVTSNIAKEVKHTSVPCNLRLGLTHRPGGRAKSRAA